MSDFTTLPTCRPAPRGMVLVAKTSSSRRRRTPQAEAPVFDPDRYTVEAGEDGLGDAPPTRSGHRLVLSPRLPVIVRGVASHELLPRQLPGPLLGRGGRGRGGRRQGRGGSTRTRVGARGRRAQTVRRRVADRRVSHLRHIVPAAGREAPRPRRPTPGSSDAHRRGRPRGCRGVVVGRGRARRERSLLLLAAQLSRAWRLPRHARRMGDATPARRGPRLGGDPPREHDRDRAHRGRHHELQGQLPGHVLARGSCNSDVAADPEVERPGPRSSRVAGLARIDASRSRSTPRRWPPTFG